jgi:hypothetical protein
MHLLILLRVVISGNVHVCLLELLHERLEFGILGLGDDTGLSEVSKGQFGTSAGPTFILTESSPPSAVMTSPILSTAFSIISIAPVLSVLVVVMTYSGGATNLTEM